MSVFVLGKIQGYEIIPPIFVGGIFTHGVLLYTLVWFHWIFSAGAFITGAFTLSLSESRPEFTRIRTLATAAMLLTASAWNVCSAQTLIYGGAWNFAAIFLAGLCAVTAFMATVTFLYTAYRS